MTAGLADARTRAFPATVKGVEEAEVWISNESHALGLGPDAEFAVSLCLEELFLNAVRHGGASRASVSLRMSAGGVELEFADDGAPFDPTLAPVKRIEGPDHNFDIGGYGSGLVQSFARRIGYRHAEGLNRVSLEFDASRAEARSRPEP